MINISELTVFFNTTLPWFGIMGFTILAWITLDALIRKVRKWLEEGRL